MRLLGNLGWLLGCCYAVARVTGVVAMVLLGYPGWLLRCCYAVAKVPGVLLGCCYCGCYAGCYGTVGWLL